MDIFYIVSEILISGLFIFAFLISKKRHKDNELISKRLKFILIEAIFGILIAIDSYILQKSDFVLFPWIMLLFTPVPIILYFIEFGVCEKKKVINLIGTLIIKTFLNLLAFTLLFEDGLREATGIVGYVYGMLIIILSLLDLLAVDKTKKKDVHVEEKSYDNNRLPESEKKIDIEENKVLAMEASNRKEQKQTRNKKELPNGFLHEGWLIAIIIEVVLVSILYITLIILKINSEENIRYVVILFISFFVVLLILLFITSLIMTVYNMKPKLQLNIDLDYEKYKNEILRRINRQNVSKETRNQFYIELKMNSFYFSKVDYETFSELVFEPTLPQDKREYDFSMLSSAMNSEEVDVYCEELKKKYPSKIVVQRIEKFKKLTNICSGKEKVDNIDLILPLHSGTNLQNGLNLYSQIQYYKNIGDLEKKDELKRCFIENYSALKTLVDELNKE